jgi:hypothetical protein
MNGIGKRHRHRNSEQRLIFVLTTVMILCGGAAAFGAVTLMGGAQVQRVVTGVGASIGMPSVR